MDEERVFFKNQKPVVIERKDDFRYMKANEPYNETDFLPMPFMTSVKERKDNFHRMDLEKSKLHNKTDINVVPSIQRKIGWEGKLL